MELKEGKNKEYVFLNDPVQQDNNRRDKHAYVNAVVMPRDVPSTSDHHVYEDLHEENKTLPEPVPLATKKGVCPNVTRYATFVFLAVVVVFIAILGIVISLFLPKINNVTNGEWGNWESWGSCTVTCDYGIISRNRNCSNPEPTFGGRYCDGQSTEYRICNIKPCQEVNGTWSFWSSWSSCSNTCMKSRTRTCTSPSPSQHGMMCLGSSEDTETCNLFSCVFKRIYVRLVNGTNSRTGRVEVSLDGWTWGTVCDDGFDYSDAKVVCRMFGYTNGTILSSPNVVSGSGPIYLDDLRCTGNESSLLNCPNQGWGNHNCNHEEDVGVSCH